MAAQLTEGAGSARALALAGLGLAFVLRAAGDAGGVDAGASWLSWLTPIGWTQRVRPFADERWWVLVLTVCVAAMFAWLAHVLSGRRDVGAGIMPTRAGPGAASPRLRSPIALAWRLQRGTAIAWTAGLAAAGAVIGGSAAAVGLAGPWRGCVWPGAGRQLLPPQRPVRWVGDGAGTSASLATGWDRAVAAVPSPAACASVQRAILRVMGTSKVPERLVWVAEALAIDPADHLLEIGCGRGVAVSLICEKLADGKITALDRSAVAIDAAKQANVKQVRSGKAAFHHTELAAFEPDGERFDKVFAVNVNLFWVRRPTPELAVIDRVLQPEGALHLFYGYGKPSTGKPGQVVDKLTVSLAERGFFIADVVTPSEGSSQMLHAMAQPRAIR